MHFLTILDRHTEIYAAVFNLRPDTERDRVLMNRNGWGRDADMNYLFLMKLNGSRVEVQWDPYNWDNSRTMGTAHHWLKQEWETKGWDYLTTLESVNVEEILKEREANEAAN